MISQTTKVFRVLSLLFTILVVVVSSWPGLQLPDVGARGLDKVAHFSQYAILAYLVLRGWGRAAGGKGRYPEWILVVLLVLFAAADEYHQDWIPGRDPDWHDWLADAAGILCGYWAGQWRWRDRRTGANATIDSRAESTTVR